MDDMEHAELIKTMVEEFSRIQSFMELCEKESAVYKAMMIRYMELKVILVSLGVDVVLVDRIR